MKWQKTFHEFEKVQKNQYNIESMISEWIELKNKMDS